jgi:hypothetical protein
MPIVKIQLFSGGEKRLYWERGNIYVQRDILPFI